LLRHLQITDKDFGTIKIAVTVSKDGADEGWGLLAPLQGTAWAAAVRAVNGESLSTALHGFALPLMREIGNEPAQVARRLKEPCTLWTDKTCPIAGPNCTPGPKLPGCYEPPGRLSAEQVACAQEVARTLADGYYVVRVVGSEFVLP
jgi:hypothetical protein